MKILNSLNVGFEKFVKYMDWAKRKGTTGKVVPCAKFLEEEKFSFQRAISKFVSLLS